MDFLKVDTNVDISLDSSPSTSSLSRSPSPIARSDTIRPSLSRQSSQSYTASTASLPSPTVKFAPLPAIGPRKRKSNQPLGMAARAQLLHKKRGRKEPDGDLVISSSPMWSSAELEDQRRRIEAMAIRYAEFQAKENAREVSLHCNDVDDEPERRRRPPDETTEDSILVFGKIVRVAGKTLWNRMAKSKEDSPSLALARPRRELSPMPILRKSVPPRPERSTRVSCDNAWNKQSDVPHRNDTTESEAEEQQNSETGRP